MTSSRAPPGQIPGDQLARHLKQQFCSHAGAVTFGAEGRGSPELMHCANEVMPGGD